MFSSRRLVVFVHGCFWHRCPYCKNGKKTVASNRTYWLPKLKSNAIRDQATYRQLRKSGWKVKVIWECQAKSPKRIARLVRSVLRESPLFCGNKSLSQRGAAHSGVA